MCAFKFSPGKEIPEDQVMKFWLNHELSVEDAAKVQALAEQIKRRYELLHPRNKLGFYSAVEIIYKLCIFFNKTKPVVHKLSIDGEVCTSQNLP